MSHKIEGRVWDMRGLPEYLKIVLVRMAGLANDDGWCNPGQADLGEEMGRDDRTIRRRIDLLERLGLIEPLARRRRMPQEYRLHVPEDPDRMTWTDPVALLVKNPDITLEPGWFNQDRPQVPGQASILLEGLGPPLERPDPGSRPGVLDRTQDRTQDRTPAPPRPDTGDSLTGHPRPVTYKEQRRDAPRGGEISEAELMALARERARSKGARNLAALTHKIYTEDREELVAEILDLRGRVAHSMAIADCDRCDDVGRAWFTPAGELVEYGHPDASSAVVCAHGSVE